MKRIIDIPEEIMEHIKNNGCLSVIYNDEVAKAIINGTPLPDLDALKKAINDAYEEYDGYDPHALSRFAERVEDLIDNALTVNEDKDIGRGAGGFR